MAEASERTVVGDHPRVTGHASRPAYVRVAIRCALAAGVCLGGAAAFPFVGAGSIVGRLVFVFNRDPSPPVVAVQISVMLPALLGGGAAWGLALSRIVNYAQTRRLVVAGALSWGPATLGLALSRGALESIGTQTFPGLPLYLIFRIVFVAAVFIVTAVTGIAFGIALRSLRAAAALALAGGLAASLGFLAVNLILDRLGMRVGGMDDSRNAIMIKTVMVSNLGAALVGGAAMGLILARHLSGYPLPPRPRRI